jgi:hypothetical protein
VVPGFGYGFAATFGVTGPGHHFLERHPEWSSRDVQGRLLEKNGFIWRNALSPEVQGFMVDLILEV